MWTSESFRSLRLLVAFLNDRKLRPEQCKVMVAPEEGDGMVYHLLYDTDLDDGSKGMQKAAVEVDLQPVAATDEGDAVDLAERIIHDAQREE